MEEPAATPDASAPPSPAVSLPLPPWLGALIGAAIGAGAWAGVLAVANYEHGIVAWAVGGLVGGGAKLCAVLALGSIAGGKVLGWELAADSAFEVEVAGALSEEAHAQHLAMLEDISQVRSATDLKGFMIAHGYTEAKAVPDVTEAEVEAFQETERAELEVAALDPPTYETWRAIREPMLEFFKELTVKSGVDAAIENLAALDLLFIGLGMYTAAKLGGGSERPYKRGARGTARSPAAKRDEEEQS